MVTLSPTSLYKSWPPQALRGGEGGFSGSDEVPRSSVFFLPLSDFVRGDRDQRFGGIEELGEDANI